MFLGVFVEVTAIVSLTRVETLLVARLANIVRGVHAVFRRAGCTSKKGSTEENTVNHRKFEFVEDHRTWFCRALKSRGTSTRTRSERGIVCEGKVRRVASADRLVKVDW